MNRTNGSRSRMESDEWSFLTMKYVVRGLLLYVLGMLFYIISHRVYEAALALAGSATSLSTTRPIPGDLSPGPPGIPASAPLDLTIPGSVMESGISGPGLPYASDE